MRYPAAVSRPGGRFFLAAAIAQVIVAGLHTFGHFQPIPETREIQAALTAMRALEFDLGLGMRPNLEDVQLSLSLTMSVMLLGAALQNLIVWRSDAAILPAIALLNTAFMAGLSVIYAWYQIPPPLITLAVVTLLFAVAWLRLRSG